MSKKRKKKWNGKNEQKKEEEDKKEKHEGFSNSMRSMINFIESKSIFHGGEKNRKR